MTPLPRRGDIATPSTPSSVQMRSTAASPSDGLPRSPSRQTKGGLTPGTRTGWHSTSVMRTACTPCTGILLRNFRVT